MKKFFSVIILLFIVQLAFSQQPIITQSEITTVKAVDGKVFFAANSGEYGMELYVSNGTHGDATLVKDINPGYSGSSPKEFTIFNDQLYFVAHTPEVGNSLWKSDGTAEGTELVYGVKDSDPSNLMVFKGHLYFTTYLGSIIRTDGTAANTQIYYQDEYTWGRIGTMESNGEYLFFTNDGRTIYRDDGTNRIDFYGPLSWEDVYYNKLLLLEDKIVVLKTASYNHVIRIYSIGYDQLGSGQEEDDWVLIKKLDAPVYGSQYIENFTNVSGRYFFSFRTDYDNVDPTDELWVCDGTEAGTKMVKSFSWNRHLSQSEMSMFFDFNGELYFRGGDQANKALWKSDGTPDGTIKVHNVVLNPPNYDERTPVAVAENGFYFSGRNGNTSDLWSSDGTTEGTRQFLNLEDAGQPAHDLSYSDDILYFITSQQFSSTLWKSLPVSDISISRYSDTLIKSGAKATIFYGVALGECKTADITISNKGLEDLYIRKIFLTGNDFYLTNKAIPETLAPGEFFTLSIVYNPVKKGKSRATLTVLSSDINESNYIIYLEATPTSASTQEFCQFSPDGYKKVLVPEKSESPLVLSNTTITEGLPVGTLVGEFAMDAEATFHLVPGQGDHNNAEFFIDGNQLKSNQIFSFNKKNLYTIRVKGTTAESDTETSFRIQIINTGTDFIADDCMVNTELMGYEYNALEVNLEGHLFITTTTGTILRSLDEGTTWEIVYKSIQPVMDIIFLESTGYAYGSSILLKSEDGGATWFRLYLPQYGEYYYRNLGVFFFTPEKGYVATDEGELFFTVDGGQTWETRFEESYYEFRDLFFTSENNGLAITGYGDLYQTTNGGRSWTAIDLSSLGWNIRAGDIWFVNDQEGFFVGDDKLYKTTDGGKNWTSVISGTGGASRIKFTSNQTGFVYGGNATVHKTSNGGETWEPIYPGVRPGRVNGITQYSGKIFIVNRDGNYSITTARAFAVSGDDGETWTTLNYFDGENIYSIDFSSGSNGFTVGKSGIFSTADAGHTWNHYETDLYPINDMLVIDEQTLILVSNGHIYKSTDAGATTRNVLTTEQSINYRPAGKLYLSPGNVLFSFSWYAFYRSEDLGETWELIPGIPGVYLQSMHFISPEIGYRVELFGSVEKTNDAGKTWEEIFVPDIEESNTFIAMHFIDENIGYKGGKNLQRTTDGGITWEKVTWNFHEIMAVHFENFEHGYVVTRGGNVYESTDAGVTWKTIFSASRNLFDVQFANNEIYLAGEYGFAARINNDPVDPALPGYIYGPSTVCVGDAVEYNLALEYGYNTQWDTNAGNIEDQNSKITVSFPESGEYSITASHFNLCRTSLTRTKTIVVSEPLPVPVISGPDPSTQGGQDVEYTVANSTEDSKYLWNVTGSTNIDPIGNSILVDWSEQAENGIINVMQIDKYGCRTNGTLPVTLVLPVAIEDELQYKVLMYPNPANESVHFANGYWKPLLIQINDALGREVLQTTVSSSQEQTLMTQPLSSGIYYVKISDGNQTVTKKLIIK